MAEISASRSAAAAAVLECKRQQQQRPMLGVVGDNDERPKTLARTDLPLPGFKEIEALIRRKELPVVFESAPDLLGASEIVENIDAGDAARARPCWRSGRSAFDRGGHGHRKPVHRKLFTFFGFGRPLQRNVNKE